MNTATSQAAATAAGARSPLLAVDGLSVAFAGRDGVVRAVDGVSYEIEAGRTLGVVGESGCGKSVAALALLGLVSPPGRITAGRVLLDGSDLLALDERRLRAIRGARISMVFQEPATALNPVQMVGAQVAESFRIHHGLSRTQAWTGAVHMLAQVGIPSPSRRARDYPHQLSGGMRQRAVIAMALACGPALLIADEPTTALDVTIQAQILDLMLDMQERMGMAIQFISHNLAVISEVAHEVMVMYAGRVVERAPARALFATPQHPYTRGLIEALPRLGGKADFKPIPGAVPDPPALPAGCRFSDRCPLATAECRAAEPPFERRPDGRGVACFKAGR